MIILDTHIWVWWVHGDARLPDHYRTYVEMHETQGLRVSVISCWEVAKLVEYGRLTLPCPVAEWLDQALAYPGIRLLELTPQIMVESTQLPGTLHRDPADHPIVATARVYHCPLVHGWYKDLGISTRANRVVASPNKGMEPTAYSVRCAPASGSGSCPALGCISLPTRRILYLNRVDRL